MLGEYTLRSEELARIVNTPALYPAEEHGGRGIVICAGGTHLAGAWVCVRALRDKGCDLPIEIWHLGDDELIGTVPDRLRQLGCVFVDARRVTARHPVRRLNGWELKCYAIMRCSFQHVLSLDADNYPLRDPSFLFDTDQYQDCGALFWPDVGRLSPGRAIWRICGVKYRSESEFESGQMVIDLARCWHAMTIAMHMNEHSDFYYRHIHGDKETYHMAWRLLDQRYIMPPRGTRCPVFGAQVQHDMEGNALFQHRAGGRKLTLLQPHQPVRGFVEEDRVVAYLDELRTRRGSDRMDAEKVHTLATFATDGTVIRLLADGSVVNGNTATNWRVALSDRGSVLVLLHGRAPWRSFQWVETRGVFVALTGETLVPVPTLPV